jgi:hypothetical protein
MGIGHGGRKVAFSCPQLSAGKTIQRMNLSNHLNEHNDLNKHNDPNDLNEHNDLNDLNEHKL